MVPSTASPAKSLHTGLTPLLGRLKLGDSQEVVSDGEKNDGQPEPEPEKQKQERSQDSEHQLPCPPTTPEKKTPKTTPAPMSPPPVEGKKRRLTKDVLQEHEQEFAKQSEPGLKLPDPESTPPQTPLAKRLRRRSCS